MAEPGCLPSARLIDEVTAPRDGYLVGDTAEIGTAVTELGGGREKKGDPIGHGAGLMVYQRVGDRIQQGTPLSTMHASDETRLRHAYNRSPAALTLSDASAPRPPLFCGRIALNSTLLAHECQHATRVNPIPIDRSIRPVPAVGESDPP